MRERVLFCGVFLLLLVGLSAPARAEDSLIVGYGFGFQGDSAAHLPLVMVNDDSTSRVGFHVLYEPISLKLVDFVPDTARIDALVYKNISEIEPGNVSVRLVVTYNCTDFIAPGRGPIGALIFSVSDFAPAGPDTVNLSLSVFTRCSGQQVNPVEVWGIFEPSSPHPRPRDPVVLGGGEDSLCLAWRPPVVGGISNLALYRIFRDIDPSMSCNTLIDSVGPDDTTYCDHGVAVYDILYYYGIMAIYEDGIPSICSELALSDITPPVVDTTTLEMHPPPPEMAEQIRFTVYDELAGLDSSSVQVYYRRPWDEEWLGLYTFYHPGKERFLALIPPSIRSDTFYYWIEACDVVVNCDSFGAYFYNDIEELPGVGSLPERFALGQNYPNPFNPVTEIRFELPLRSWVRLEIYDVLGRRVAVLVDGLQPAGHWVARWDGRDEGGRGVASGIYLYRLRVGEIALTRQMVLLR